MPPIDKMFDASDTIQKQFAAPLVQKWKDDTKAAFLLYQYSPNYVEYHPL